MYQVKQFLSLFFVLFFSLLLSACNGGGGSSGTANTDPNPTPDPTPPVPEVNLESLSLSIIDSTLDINETFQLTATGRYSDDSERDLSDQVTWTVEQTDIATVSSSGLLIARSAGSTTITASKDGVAAQVALTVRALERLSLTPGSISLAINSSQSISVTGIYSDNSTQALDSLVEWTSENTDIATVTENGLITAIKPGSTSVSAEFSGLSRSLTVTVSPARLQSITVSATESQVPAGLNTGISATGLYSDGTELDLSNQVFWSVSNVEFAEIDPASGVLTGLKAGTVNVIAAKEGLSGSLTVTVSPAQLIDLQVSPAELSLAKGTSQSVVVTAVFSDLSKQDVSDQILWDSSDEAKATAKLGSSQIEALGLGNSTLTASLLGQQVNLEVTVTDAQLVSLLISPANTKLPLGVSQQFVAQGFYTDDSVQDISNQVTWLSSNEATALISNSVNQKGELESKALGKTIISAVLGDIQQSTDLTIEDTQLTSIEILPVTQTVSRGTEARVQAIGHYTNGARFDITNKVNWNTSSTKLININQARDGKVKALAVGDAVLNAELRGITSFASIAVNAAVIEGIAIVSASTTVAQNSKLKLLAQGYFSDGTNRDISAQVTWQSSNSSVLSVTNNAQGAGVISGLKAGNAQVKASFGGLFGQREFTVSNAVLTGLQISSPVSSVNVNGTLQASARASFSDGTFQDVTRFVNWLSSASAIASIDNSSSKKGLLKALARGEVQIRATMAGVHSEPLTIQVTENANLPLSMTVSLQPNVILNNADDVSEIIIRVLPSKVGGKIPNGTPVKLSITEGDETRIENLTTFNGVASYTLSSAHEGMLKLTASSDAVSTSAGLLSTPGLWQAIAVKGFSSFVYENERLKKGSVFLASLRNMSNRVFAIEAAAIQYRDPVDADTLIQFDESPFFDPDFLSDGDLTAAEYTFIGYELDFDIQAKIYQIIYYITDMVSSSGFTLGIEFDFSKSEETVSEETVSEETL